VRWPDHIEAGSVCHEVVTTPDFYPTFLGLAGIKVPREAALDGVSLLPLLNQSSALDRDAVYWHYPHYHHSSPGSAIREGDWKLIEFLDDGRLELYNLRQDLSETLNLAPYLPDKAAELRAKLEAWRQSVNVELPQPNPDYDPSRAQEWGRHPGRG